MFLRRLLLATLVAISGCAAMQQDGYEWTLSSRPALPYVWFAAGQEGVRAICHQQAGFTPNACAIYEPDACWIVAERSERETPVWLAAHEARHCKGWDHKAPVLFPHIAVR